MLLLLLAITASAAGQSELDDGAPSITPGVGLPRPDPDGTTTLVGVGIYVIDMLLENLRGTPAEAHVNSDGVDWLRPFGGVRIEDNVRVTTNGCENLTRDAFTALH